MKNSTTHNQRIIKMRGFSLLEVCIVVLILAIVTTFSLMGVAKARSSFQLVNAGDTLKVYLEKAIADSKRRHTMGNDRAKILVMSSTTYQVTIDFDGDGNPESRLITLPKQVTFEYDASNPVQATIDWRGRVAEGSVTFRMRSDLNENLAVELTGQGDASINQEFPTLPSVSVTPTSADVKTSAVLIGNSSTVITPTPTQTPLPYCSNNQKPAVDNCRCESGEEIDKKGKCK